MSYVPTTQQQGQGGAQVGQAQVLPQLDFTGARIAVDSMKKAGEAARIAEQKQKESQTKLNERFGVIRSAMYPPALQGGYDNTLESTLEKIKKDPKNASAYLSGAEEIKKVYDERSKLLSKDVLDLMQKDVYFKPQALAAFNDYDSIRASGEKDPFKISGVVSSALGQTVPINENLGKGIYDFSKRLSTELLNTEGAENLFVGDVNVIRDSGFVGAQSIQKLSPEGREYVIDQIYGTPEVQRQLVGKFFSADPTETERLAKDYIRNNMGFEKVMGLSQAASGGDSSKKRFSDLEVGERESTLKNPYDEAVSTGISGLEKTYEIPNFGRFVSGKIPIKVSDPSAGENVDAMGQLLYLGTGKDGKPAAFFAVDKPSVFGVPQSSSVFTEIEIPLSDVESEIIQSINKQYDDADIVKRNQLVQTIDDLKSNIANAPKKPFPKKELESTYNKLHEIATSIKSDAVKTDEIQKLLGRDDVSYVGGFSTTDLNVGGKEVKLFKFGSKSKLSGEDLRNTLSTLYDADAIIRSDKEAEERALPKANSGQAPPPPPSQR